jgi:hypothetical protein
MVKVIGLMLCKQGALNSKPSPTKKEGKKGWLIIIIIIDIIGVLAFELRASHLLGRHYTT